ncbi:AT-rich interactive domain-containing protein 4B [Eupeodes corollae]|uniref:AT-rich interactive domain-containing protein 4B n=1 Tax=Eupeodes corollae TaxID=290404 RepID=UPI002492A0D6|nr:AT-rich interactive domain-containing protein 4B [Eupeodes corollae]
MQQVDDPPSLPVGTEVSAKYKGAFCEAKVRKVVRNIKVKVAFKHGLGSGVVSDDAIKSGQLRVGSTVEVKHPDRRENVEGTVMKIQDCSQYTVVFDDGDITTLRRTALCLKSGRHFNESETLDQLPLTHPEHFGNPVVGGRRGRRSRHLHDDSSDEDDESDAKEVINEKEENIGKVVCVESTDSKKKDKEKWFPGLVVSPTAQVTVRIRVKDEYLVRSFKDGRYYTVPKKEAMEFTREQAHKQDNAAVQAALEYLDSDILPTHWDRDSLFGLANSSSEYEEADSDSSDDEPSEEKDLFIAQLYKYMDDRGTPLNKVPSIQNRDVDFYRLFRAVQKLGGYNRVTTQNQWKSITIRLGFTPITVSVTNLVKQAYKKFLQPYEDFHRKLGCSMIMTPRNANRTKGRSLVRANSVASPKPADTSKEAKPSTSSIPVPSTSAAVVVNPPPTNDESENTSESSVEVTVAKAATKRKSSVGAGKVKSLVEKFEEKAKEECDIPLAKIQKSSQRSTERKSSETPNTTRENSPTGSIGPTIKKEKQKKPPQEEKRGPKPKKKEETQEKVEVGDFPVEVGDKLKVYYHEKKVTYEAKVIEISVTKGSPLYLVHYTGWNNRYDEWVPRERIAENLTNNKLKKTRVGGASSDKGKTEKSENPPKPPSVISPGPGKTPTSSVKRGRGRSDSQPPRSTTPCSVASNSSRTKSPAASSARKKTPRTIPNSMRRTSNNVSDVSMQTSSDSDSDEPVRRPTRATRDSKGKGTQASRGKSPASVTATSTKSNSASESDEDEEADDEEMPETSSSNAKGRDYDLNQIRSELKGFQELKSPTSDPETDTADQQDSKSESLFDFKPKEEESSDQKHDETTKSSDSDSSSDGTDSFADDDSQSSDKTTTLENMTEKLQLKINADKKALLEKFPLGKAPEKAGPSRIEKIIKESLAEKRQESLKAKPFIAEESLKVVKTEVKLEPIETVNAPAPPAATQVDKKPFPMILESATKPTVNLTRIGKYPVIMDKPLVIKEDPSEPVSDPLKLEEPVDVKEVVPAPPPPQPTPDIYEFKEPEPFEFEARKTPTAAAAGTSEAKKKAITAAAPKPTPPEQPSVSPLSATFGKKKKASPIKESPEKPKQMKMDDKISLSSLSAAMSNLLTPQKNETTLFDALRKSPSFNLNFNALHEELATTVQETTRALTDVPPPEQLTPTKCGSGEEATDSAARVVGSPFIETTCDLSNVFELNQDADGLTSSDEAKDNKFELENVKILLCDSSFDLEPIKVEKPSSIADKVLRAISQKKEEEEKNKCEVPVKIEADVKPKVLLKEEDVKIDEDNLPSTSNSSTSNSNSNSSSSAVSTSPFITEPPKIEDVTCTLVKSEFELTPKRSLLTSPEPKIGILESIPVKNNVLNETIQKLECAIQKTTAAPSVDHFVEESSDSNDSEQRLIIEDEDDRSISETSRTMTPVEVKQPQEVKKPEEPGKAVVPSVVEAESRTEEVENNKKKDEPVQVEVEKQVELPVSDSVSVSVSVPAPPASISVTVPAPSIPSSIVAVPSPVTIQQVQSVLPQPKLPSPVPVKPLVVPSIFNLPQTFYSDPNLQPEDGVKPIFDIRPVEVCASQPPERPQLEPVSIIEQVVAVPQQQQAQQQQQQLDIKKDDQAAESLNLHTESINLLLCEETIPGSPCSMVGKDVLDPLAICRSNSHPTESDIKPVPMDIECSTPMSKPPPPMEAPMKPGPTPNSSPNDSASQDESGEELKKQVDIENEVSPKKRRRTRKQSEMMMETQAKRRRPLANVKKNNGSDSEDNSDTISQRSSSSRHNRPCQYNFLVQLDPTMNPDQRIALLLKQIQDLRKTYNMIKGDLASIDRRRKKMRRREREKKQMQLHQQAIKINS